MERSKDLSNEELQKQFDLLEQAEIDASAKKVRGRAGLTEKSTNYMRIIDNVDLLQFYNENVVHLAKIFKPMATKAAICPFHKDTDPSFHAQRIKKYYHCFGCGYTGDVIRVFMQLQFNYYDKVLTEQEAILLLSKMYHIELVPEEEDNTHIDIFDKARMMLTGKRYMHEYTGIITLTDYEKNNRKLMQSNLDFERKLMQLGELDRQLATYFLED